MVVYTKEEGEGEREREMRETNRREVYGGERQRVSRGKSMEREERET